MCTSHRTSDDIIYLRPMQPSCSVIEPRRYCKECGLIHERGGKHISYFINRLQDLSHMIRIKQNRLGIHPLTKVERRVILKTMQSLQTFTDPYGVSFESQKETFIQIIKIQRDRLPEALIEDIISY